MNSANHGNSDNLGNSRVSKGFLSLSDLQSHLNKPGIAIALLDANKLSVDTGVASGLVAALGAACLPRWKPSPGFQGHFVVLIGVDTR